MLDKRFFNWLYDKERKLRRIGRFKGRRAVNVVKIPSLKKKIKPHVFFKWRKEKDKFTMLWGGGGGRINTVHI